MLPKRELVYQMIALDHMYGPWEEGDFPHVEND